MRRLLDKVQDLLRKRLVGLGLWTESGHISKKKKSSRIGSLTHAAELSAILVVVGG
jgi:hypothetical protein